MSELSIRSAALDTPDELALIDEQGSLTFRALADLADRSSSELARVWTRSAAPVLLVPRPTRSHIATLFALLEHRIPFVLAAASWTDLELEHALRRTGARAVYQDGLWRPITRPDPAPLSPGAQVFVFTSGSSGRPKVVCLSRDALKAAAHAHGLAMPWIARDRWALTLPLAHIGGFSVLTRSLAARRPVVLGPARFNAAELVERLRRSQVTLLSLVPTMLRRLIGSGPPSSLRAVLLGGAPTDPTLLKDARAAGWPALPTYGMSETCAQICTQRLGDMAETGVGQPLPGVDIQIDSEGEIIVRGPSLMNGYLAEPALEPGTWYRTGDIGRWDRRGHLQVLGRRSARIITGGENVDPVEVQAALLLHPAIEQAAVFGQPDPDWGEIVVALIVSSRRLSEDELKAHLSPRLARYKHPKRVERRAELPRLKGGKLDRAALKAPI